MSPTRMKNSSVAGTHNNRNAPPFFKAAGVNFVPEIPNEINIATPEDASTATHIGYTRAGHGAYMAASVRKMTTGETRLPTAIQGNTVTPPKKVSVARTFIWTDPCDAKYSTV